MAQSGPRFMKRAPWPLPLRLSGSACLTYHPTSWAQERRGYTLHSLTSGPSGPRPGARVSMRH